MRAILVIPGLLVASVLGAQAPDLHALPLPGSRKDDLALPLFASNTAPATASRLNALLQLTYLEGVAKPGDKDPFSRVRYDSNREGSGSTSALSWSSSNQGRVIAIQVMSEITGAYSTENTDDLLLDAIHGQPVMAADLFTPEGLKALRARLALARKTELRRVIQSERKGKPDADTEDCLAVQEEALKDQAFDGVQNLGLDDADMTFPASLDLPHVVEACNVNLTITVPRGELAPYLSAYGKALLDASLPSPRLPSAWTSRVFTGRIGTAPVVMHLLRAEDGSITGEYAYLKRGTGIELSGRPKGGVYELDESNADGDTTGKLTFHDRGTRLEGTWISPDGARLLPFIASAE